MSISITPIPYTLQFKFDAGTSRGVLREKKIWILQLTDSNQPQVTAYGECGPLAGLSIDDIPDFELQLQRVCTHFNESNVNATLADIPTIVNTYVPNYLPSVRFGLETALYDYCYGGKQLIFPTTFTSQQEGIPINGLIWMGAKDFMLSQIKDKLAQGYTTIKLKIGAIDFAQECELLSFIRAQFSPAEIELRVDANGAFSPTIVQERLAKLATYSLHSIEQPIKAGQLTDMQLVAAQSPVPVALDEELIGIRTYEEKRQLLTTIRPPYIILKPSLLGGFQQTSEWISLANELQIGWWITSALEANIGLNAIAQFTAQFAIQMPQGLGTGQLYHNNFPSPLTIEKGHLYYNQQQTWDFSDLPL